MVPDCCSAKTLLGLRVVIHEPRWYQVLSGGYIPPTLPIQPWPTKALTLSSSEFPPCGAFIKKTAVLPNAFRQPQHLPFRSAPGLSSLFTMILSKFKDSESDRPCWLRLDLLEGWRCLESAVTERDAMKDWITMFCRVGLFV